ncbi:hypothetical protein AJ79_02681 [Helicocarpus griseus UAMH5409]|uniref:Uncharacterized protein n=1 Tax=Helicocarpus griseus UAMH5409 TaxID=1447875 RepID=A0A2B7Y1T2_9EURO|nr:hypothetical protein AJ79_02681 [Helicocarpus griseus UAMH5409]
MASHHDELHFVPLHTRSSSDHIPRRSSYQPVPSSSDPLDEDPSPPMHFQGQRDTPGSQASSAFGLGIRDRLGNSRSSHPPSPEIQRNTSTNTPPQAYSISSTPTFLGNASPGRQPNYKCPSVGNVRQKRTSWLTITILVLAFYSTALSGLFMIVAFVRPRYGDRIGPGGLAPDTASLLSALFAKTIELSFVTVFVAFLGQVLSRRALTNQGTGISIADMSMRNWIMQPGSLITHWQHVKFSGLTVVGMIALTATFMALFYTTAADALVSPKLNFGPKETLQFTGLVKSPFASVDYLNKECLTPVSTDEDRKYSASTCLQLSFVGQCYHNYREFLSDWSRSSRAGNKSSTEMKHRIAPAGTWNDNTTVQGTWIHEQDMSELSHKHGRMVVNVTAAMPHAGLIKAARHPANSLRQPKDFNGLGEFDIQASVVSPVVNVLCAGMTADELSPIIYESWPNRINGSDNLDFSKWNTGVPKDIPIYPEPVNRTVVDDLFDFTDEFPPPIFPKLPSPFNTIVNGTKTEHLGYAGHLLLTSPNYSTEDKQFPKHNPEYTLCAIKAGLTTQCSTKYHATASGGRLEVVCDDPTDEMRYNKSKEKEMPLIDWSMNWENMATEWANSLSLGAGVSDGYASNARLLTQFTPTFDPKTNTSSLSPTEPSSAEALAAMAASTLLMSTEDASFHLENVLKPTNETFKATLRVSDYYSGGAQAWQSIFYVVLVLVFLTNLVCLAYMYLEIKGEQLTDFTDPQNMFALALNSAGSTRLNGACGAGPKGSQLAERWVIGMEEESEHYYISSKAEMAEMRQRELENQHLKPDTSPAVKEYRRISKHRTSISLFN